jgi:histidinol-phosphate aminotransferase
MYRHLSQSLGLNYHGVGLKPDTFELNADALLQIIVDYRPALIFLAYPNNPTGNLYDTGLIRTVLEASSGLVVIDEAYAPFAEASFMPALDDYANLAVMRTVSKLGLAGLRLGYLAAHPALITELDKIRLPYNINSLTQLTADFALSHKDVFDQQTQAICAERARVFVNLKQLNGVTPYPSAANFILFKTPAGQAGAIFESIKQQGVLIKNLNKQSGLLTDCLRVTIGKPDENDCFLKALENSL